MKVNKMEAGLYCTKCKDETNHEITYINNHIKRIRCQECNETMEMNMDLKKDFYKEIYERVSSKPTRITEEYHENLRKLLLSLPYRAIKKPYRILKEVHSSRRVIKTYNPKKK
ncbi:hypothetical protein JMA_09010 [Jeotgalibacillus malaysiensis]|uniref:Bh protein n=1 Tax=Jeotgalibacillus malaysiensis TaxID=1508404 RepID=A0A0B5ANV4_9BACL|nr:hypothetical protein [Jeotgalibacillus malaysiensis]AJD90218.1 hypothetical protein JMA_09010 [Jeotgalibacillus malaysiensis]